MTENQQTSKLNQLAKAIDLVLNPAGSFTTESDERYRIPIRVFFSERWDRFVLEVEGMFEWVGILGGDSIYAGELGNYGLRPNIKLQYAIQKIQRGGQKKFLFEAMTQYEIAIFDD